MTIHQNRNGSELTLSLEGRLDTSTAPELEKVIRESLNGVTALTLDCGKLEYISSAGLRVLMIAQKTMNKQGSMKLTNVADFIMEVFELTGFSSLLTIV